MAGLVLERIPATLLLMGTSLTLALLIGVAIGILGAVRRYSVFDYATTTAAMLALSLPTFWFGLLAIYIFAQELGWLPAGGIVPLGGGGLARRALASRAARCWCWRWCWSRNGAATPARRCWTSSTRTSCGPPAPRVCRRARVLFGHGLRAALVPLVTLLGLQTPPAGRRRAGDRDRVHLAGHGAALRQLALDARLSGADGDPDGGASLVVLGNLAGRLLIALDRSADQARGHAVTDLTATADLEQVAHIAPRGRALRRFGRHRLAVVGAGVVVLLILATVFAHLARPLRPACDSTLTPPMRRR